MCFIASLIRLLGDRRGNVMMIMGFALIPITFATGMVIDYSRAARLQTKLNAAADASALAATTKPMMDQPLEAACNAARNTFLNALQQNKNGLTFDGSTNLQISVTETYAILPVVNRSCAASILNIPSLFTKPLSRTMTVTYTGASQNAFGGVLRQGTIAIGGTSTAKTAVAPYIDIYVALDTSQSMGLAATDADAKKLFEKTRELNGRGCQFGCHSRSPNEKYSMEEIARRPDVNVRMRVDILRDATIDMIDTASVAQAAQKLYRFGLFRIGRDFNALENIITPLTDNLAVAKSSVSGLQLGPNDGAIGYGDTNLSDMLDNLKPMMGITGDGTRSTSPRGFLFIVTDGVQDLCGASHCTSVIDATKCQKYKDAGITVGIVYTTYLPVKEDPTNPANTNMRGEYNNFIAHLPPERIAPALQTCASPGWFFEASDGPTIHTAMQNLFRQATQTPAIVR